MVRFGGARQAGAGYGKAGIWRGEVGLGSVGWCLEGRGGVRQGVDRAGLG
ncbi:hypothetical protein LCGC14_0644310 [marine sediment metagenome]|uniref:Uncharacterized protein n=1 Tax=marine sediment metagenome TaxID=412755 RepID=A0A0F9RHY1_9ZZZZ